MEAKRDWGHAKDYVKAMWLMLQQYEPDDYVICSGKVHSVREFCKKAFEVVGLNYKNYVGVNEKFFRPSEKNVLSGDYSKAKIKLNWEPKISFDEIIQEMVEGNLDYYSEKSK